MAAAPDPDEVLRSTDEKANFQRVTLLLISGGTVLMREIFDQLCPPSNLSTILQNSKKQLKKAKLTKPQRDILNPSTGVYGKSEDFDIALLFVLLKTICNLVPPVTGWDALPASTDHSLAADLARLKYYRNTVHAHAKEDMADMRDVKFLLLWEEISAALVRIAGQISSAKKNEWQVEIDRFLTRRLTPEDERNVQELIEWYRYEMDLKDSAQKIQEDMERLRETSMDLKDSVKKNHDGIERIEKKMEELKTASYEPNERLEGLEKCPVCGLSPCVIQGGSKEPSALLQMIINCIAMTAKPDSKGGSPDMEAVNPSPTSQDVLNRIATLYLKEIKPSTPEEFNGFVHYMENVKKVMIVDTQSGSLIITVKCRSLKILQELWDDYCIGRVNEMAQKFLVTKEVLKELNLAAAKLETTILEEEYRACRETLLLFSELERLKRQRDEFQSKFLHWAHTRKCTRDLLAEFVTKLCGISLSGTTLAALVAGAIAIPFTFGTSMALGAAAAVGAGAAGTVMNTWETQNKATEVIVQDRKACQELQEKLGSLEQCTSDFADFCHEHYDSVFSSELVKDEFGFLLDILQRKDREEFEAEKAEVLAPTLPTLLQDEVSIYFMRVSTFMRQLQRSTATSREISTIIQHILAELRECPNEEEMQKMIENFIEETFDRKLSRLGFCVSGEATGLRESASLPPLPAPPQSLPMPLVPTSSQSLPNLPLLTPPQSTLPGRSRKTSKKKKKAYAQ